MRAIGHFCLFVGYFLVFALMVGLLLLGVAELRSPVAILNALPLLLGSYGLYARGYRAVLGHSGDRRRVSS